jgi:linoleoyl-CoA desaturase
MKSKTSVRFINLEKNLFFSTLKERVDQYFESNEISKNANSGMVVKTILLFCGYILPFIYLLIFQPPLLASLIIWFFIGVCLAGIGMNIMHDANHGAFSSSRKINDLLGHTSLSLLGGSSHNWKLQHNVLHHTYTNVAEMDDDIDGKTVMKFNPHSKSHGFHKLQFVYAFFFYGIQTLYWVTVKDFVQFYKYTKNGVNKNRSSKNVATFIKIILLKIVYFSIVLALPVWVGIPFWEVLSGFLLMHFVAGIILTVVFQLAHTVENTSYPLPDEKGNIENSWAIHQLNTTVNFARKSKLLSWYVGGLNFQVEHHLFPMICHVHYPNLAEIVKSTAEEFNVPYLENNTFFEAFKSHIRTLKKFGNLPDMDEALG